MNNEKQVKQIADEVDRAQLIAVPESNAGFYVTIGQNLASATYVGRKEEFSVIKFRAHMILAAAYCQRAVGVMKIGAVLTERIRQDRMWGDRFDKRNTANDWHAYVGHYISKAMQGDTEEYDINMIKACGICQAAALMVDRYGGPSMRHYENLPGAGAHCEHCGGVEGANHVCPTVNDGTPPCGAEMPK